MGTGRQVRGGVVGGTVPGEAGTAGLGGTLHCVCVCGGVLSTSHRDGCIEWDCERLMRVKSSVDPSRKVQWNYPGP